MTIVHNPKNEQVIDELYVALSKEESGEGIVSMLTGMGAMPFVFGHKQTMDRLKHHLVDVAKESGKTVKIYRFTKAELLEEIK